MSLEEAMDNFTRGRRRKYGPIDLTKPPTEEELNGQTPQQREDYSLFSPQQIEQETRPVTATAKTRPGTPGPLPACAHSPA